MTKLKLKGFRLIFIAPILMVSAVSFSKTLPNLSEISNFSPLTSARHALTEKPRQAGHQVLKTENHIKSERHLINKVAAINDGIHSEKHQVSPFLLANGIEQERPLSSSKKYAPKKVRRRENIAPPPLAEGHGTYRHHRPGRLITLNFTNIPTRELLQIIAQFTGLNFVISDSVKGSMSIHLKNIPWTQAMQVILKSQGLGKRQVGNIVYVAPIKELARQEIEELQAQQQVANLAQLQNRLIYLKYANAEDVAKLLSSKSGSLLSPRGTVAVDKRTNSLWIRDNAKNLAIIARLIRGVDHPVKQILIEARIVSIETPYERQLGVRFGITKPDHLSGTLEGANALQQGIAPEFIPIGDRLNFDVPAASIFNNSPGTIGVALAKIGGGYLLDLELSALEREGIIELVSSPRLVTSNQNPAYIKVGEEIPYQTATSSGATAIEFKDAVLQLEVTPQITPDKRVVLKIKVSNNRAGAPVPLDGGGSAIPIETEEEESSVLLDNNQTIVLGGVYRQEKRNIIVRVPFLGKIPVLGVLFKKSEKVNDKRELLIFLTPHIIFKPSNLT